MYKNRNQKYIHIFRQLPFSDCCVEFIYRGYIYTLSSALDDIYTVLNIGVKKLPFDIIKVPKCTCELRVEVFTACKSPAQFSDPVNGVYTVE